MRKTISVCPILAIVFMLLNTVALSADELKVGIMVPITGSEEIYGKDMENAFLLAVSEINAKGGIKGKAIVTTTADDACDPQQATSAASKLVSEEVIAVVGGYCSGATLPTLKIYANAGIPIVITAANSTKLVKANPGNAFLINSTGDHQATTAVKFFKQKAVKKLAVIHQGDAYSEDLARLTEREAKKRAIEVVAMEIVNKGMQDYSSLVTRLKFKTPDAVFWTAYYADGALIIKQLRQGGYMKLIAVGDGSNSPRLIKIAGKAAEGILCFSNPTVEYLPEAKAFCENYRKRFHQEPGPYSALSYDGMKLLADAIQRAGALDSEAVSDAMKATRDFKGITGPIAFTPDNRLFHSNFVVLVAKGGNWTMHK